MTENLSYIESNFIFFKRYGMKKKKQQINVMQYSVIKMKKSLNLLTLDDHGDALWLDISLNYAWVQPFIRTSEGGKTNGDLGQILAYGGRDGEVFRVEPRLGTPIGGHVDNGLAIPLDVEVGPVVVIGHCAADLFTSLPDFSRRVLYPNLYQQFQKSKLIVKEDFMVVAILMKTIYK